MGIAGQELKMLPVYVAADFSLRQLNCGLKQKPQTKVCGYRNGKI